MQFGASITDVLETRLFGPVDRKGAAAVDFFRFYQNPGEGMRESYRALIAYIGAQKFRTPRGLDWLKRQVSSRDNTQTLLAMSALFQAYETMWMEGVWEIVHARRSNTKFIVTDDPVTFFNRRLIPNGVPPTGGDDFPKVGTRTIFPLAMDSCLIITHLQLVRNPWHDPLRRRENARSFQPTLAKFTDIQFGRELDEDEVLRINLILKRSAARFIAAPSKDALYPERRLAGVYWADIDRDWFLFPNLWKVGFTTRIMVGYEDGGAWGMDEYGRNPWHPDFEDEGRRRLEHRRFDEGKREWAKKRIGKSLARVPDLDREDRVGDLMMNSYLRDNGLLPREDTATPEGAGGSPGQFE
jgi:hypothetical protein